jgi:hypothetical protein
MSPEERADYIARAMRAEALEVVASIFRVAPGDPPDAQEVVQEPLRAESARDLRRGKGPSA